MSTAQATRIADERREAPAAIYKRLLAREAAGEELSNEETTQLAGAIIDLNKQRADVDGDLSAFEKAADLEAALQGAEQAAKEQPPTRQLLDLIAAEDARIIEQHKQLVAEKVRLLGLLARQRDAENQVRIAHAVLGEHRRSFPHLF